jgi:hypothetical protein
MPVRCLTLLVINVKGAVQRKLTGVLSGINRKLMIRHCSDGYSFFNLKGLRSLKSKNVFSALTGILLFLFQQPHSNQNFKFILADSRFGLNVSRSAENRTKIFFFPNKQCYSA